MQLNALESSINSEPETPWRVAMKQNKHGVTMVELIVVLGIISILSTIAVGIYIQELQRAKIAKTRAEIRNLGVAINRYQIDVGQFPPTGTGQNLAPLTLNNPAPYSGNGYMQVALRASLNGNSQAPLDPRWVGPYIEFQENRLGTLTGSPIDGSTSSPAEVQFLDAWGNPYDYINSSDYATFGGTFLPASSPYRSTEVFYNVSTFQLISRGPNGTTDTSGNARGTEPDDLPNWEATGY